MPPPAMPPVDTLDPPLPPMPPSAALLLEGVAVAPSSPHAINSALAANNR